MSLSLIGNSSRHRATSPADGIALPPWIGTALERAVLEPADRAHPRARRREVGHVADHLTERGHPVADLATHPSLHLQHPGLLGVREERPGAALRDHAR